MLSIRQNKGLYTMYNVQCMIFHTHTHTPFINLTTHLLWQRDLSHTHTPFINLTPHLLWQCELNKEYLLLQQ